MMRMGRRKGVSKGKRGRTKGMERKPESGDVRAEKRKGGGVGHRRGSTTKEREGERWRGRGGSSERLVFQNTFHLCRSKTEGGVGNRGIWQLTCGSTFFPCLLFPHLSLPKHP